MTAVHAVSSGGADVLVVGSLNVDLVCTLARRPAPGETVVGDQLQHYPGGKGANQAAAAARAAASTRLVGAVGADLYGHSYLHELTSRGVDTSHVSVLDDAATGVALIDVTPDGENSIVTLPGANARLRPAHLPRPSSVKWGGVVVCQLEIPLEVVTAAAELCAEVNGRFMLNPSPIQHLPRRLLEACEPAVVNVHETHHLLGRGAVSSGRAAVSQGCTLAAEVLRMGCKSVVVTLGRAGAVWVKRRDGSETQCIHAVAPHVDVVDTTGAGDAFAGTLAAAISRGDADRTALEEAVEAGSVATTWRGAQPWQFDAHAATNACDMRSR